MKNTVKIVFLLLPILVFTIGNIVAQDFTLQNVVTESIAPNRWVNKGSGHYFMEFPKAAFGTIDITITASSSQSVTIRFGEKKNGDAVDTDPGYDIVYKSETINVTPGTRTYRVVQHPSVWPGGQPDPLFATIPFRYVEVMDCPDSLNPSKVRQIAVFYPFNERASRFISSNNNLNKVWDFSKYSMKACSWLGIYVDGTRERAPYEADAYIQLLGHYCQDTQAYAIARNSFSYLLTNPTWPAEWKFHSIFAAYAEYMWTGDTSFLSSNYYSLKDKTLETYARSDGLVGPPGPGGGIGQNAEIVDWPPPNRDSYDFGEYCAATNALYYKALVLMSKIASVLGKTADASSYANKAQQVYNSFQSVYYDSSQGAYRDSEDSGHYAIHSSAFALAVGLVPQNRISAVTDYVKSRGMSTGVYGAQYLLEGIYNADEEEHGLSLLAATGSRSWIDMMAQGTTVSMEAWPGYSLGNQCTWNHAWGAAPANLIPRCLMGIEPIEAGFSKIQIKPQIGSLSNASIKIPTIKGSIKVAVAKGVTYKIAVCIPSGATAKVYVKDYNSQGTTVMVDGVPQNGTMEGKYVIFDNVSSGFHTFKKVMYGSTPGDGPGDGYIYCADEGDSFTLPGPADCAYGADGLYNYLYNLTGTITFDNNTFGDPIVGTVKQGYYKLVEPTPPTTDGPGDGYIYCADEGDSFTLPGSADCAYGADGSYNYLYNQTGTIIFDNNTFGDPIIGTVKQGYYKLVD